MPVIIGFGFLMAAALLLSKKVEAATRSVRELTPIPTVKITSSLDEMIKEAAFKYGVDARIVKAVAMTESSLDPNASNPSDPSYGLMGIMPILAEDFGIVKDWHNVTEAEVAMIRDPETNLRIGAWYLSRLLSKYPFVTAIQMYNVGEAGYNSGHRNSGYLAKVKAHYAEA